MWHWYNCTDYVLNLYNLPTVAYARQVPKLPDYAIIDIRQPVTAQKPGGIAAADFFDEYWQIPPAKKEN